VSRGVREEMHENRVRIDTNPVKFLRKEITEGPATDAEDEIKDSGLQTGCVARDCSCG
jgi:hypothetical protein